MAHPSCEYAHKYSIILSNLWSSFHSTACLTRKRIPCRKFSRVDGEADQVSMDRYWHCSQILHIKTHASQKAGCISSMANRKGFLGLGSGNHNLLGQSNMEVCFPHLIACTVQRHKPLNPKIPNITSPLSTSPAPIIFF